MDAYESGERSFIATFDPAFADMAVEEIVSVADNILSQHELGPGVLLVKSEVSFPTVAHRWREQPPVFVRHICQAQAEIPLSGDPAAESTIESVALETCAPLIDSDREFSVQTRVLADVGFKPYDVNKRLADALTSATGAAVNVRNPEQVVSLVCTRNKDGDAIAYVGVSDVEDNLSDWAGGMRRFARESGQVSRSEFKLLEALEVFQIELEPRGVALDLGAAPGGWTRVLRQHELYVTAVDPGDLHPSLVKDAGVRHLKMTSEQYLEREPDRYDLIVNDMRMDGRDSARLMVRYARCLYPGGQVIMTLKLPERGRRSVVDHSLRILRSAYDVLGMKHLFHNRSEITLFLASRPS